MLTALPATLVLALAAVSDPVPEEEDVVAGWGAFALFGLLILAVAVLGISLTRRLKNVDRAEEQGLYDPSTKKKDKPAGWPTYESAAGPEAPDRPGAVDPPQEK